MNLLKKHLALLLLFISVVSSAEELNPSFGTIYLQNEITTIELDMNESDKHNLIHPNDLSNNTYYQASIHIQSSRLDTLFGPVGVRLRGNTSRSANKKSFKIDFKEYGGEQVYKLKKLNLKPNVNDLSLIREPLSWLFYREMNVPAARTTYVKLYMNDEYMGLYQSVEHIDDEFVDRRYGNEAGNLYKCAWGASLDGNTDCYNNELFELKTNEEINDRSLFQELVDVLNSDDDENWEDRLRAVFDVDNYIRQMAVEAFIGHWDGYSYNTNNYYLYENPESGKIHFIPYDLDNTWGIDWIGPDWATEDIMSWYTDRFDVPLTKRILESSTFYAEFVFRLHDVMDIAPGMEMQIDYLHQLIADEVSEDPYYGVDFGYGVNDFNNSLENGWGGHIKYGVVDYLYTRLDYAESQVPVVDSVDELAKGKVTVYPNPCVDNLTLISPHKIHQIILYASDGREIRRWTKPSSQIHLNGLKSGTYILQAKTSVGMQQQIILKTN